MDGRHTGGVRDDARSSVSTRFRRRADRTAQGKSLTTLRLTIEYDGTDYCGFQWQPHVRTVAGVLETALAGVLGEAVKVTGAGRTDSGVHATGQVVSLSTAARFPFDRLGLALRSALGQDCCVRDIAVVPEAFSARFSATERAYVYAIHNRPEPSALAARYAYHIAGSLDLAAMRAAGDPLLGEHDFRAFSTAEATEPTLRRLLRLQIDRHADFVRVEVVADGFLHRMVRIIVGTLIECGLGRRSPADLAEILKGRDRTAAGTTAPPQGLYLAGVRYRDGYDSFAEPPILGAMPPRRTPPGVLPLKLS